MKRRTFSREFKLAAVNKVVVQGLSFTEVARDLRIRDTLIHNWKKPLRRTERSRPKPTAARR